MPKIKAPEPPRKIKAKGVGGRPQKVGVHVVKKPTIKVSMDLPDRLLVRLDAQELRADDMERRIKKIGHVLKELMRRMAREGEDIDTAFINNEQTNKRLDKTFVVASVALVIAIMAFVVAVV